MKQNDEFYFNINLNAIYFKEHILLYCQVMTQRAQSKFQRHFDVDSTLIFRDNFELRFDVFFDIDWKTAEISTSIRWIDVKRQNFDAFLTSIEIFLYFQRLLDFESTSKLPAGMEWQPHPNRGYSCYRLYAILKVRLKSFQHILLMAVSNCLIKYNVWWLR